MAAAGRLRLAALAARRAGLLPAPPALRLPAAGVAARQRPGSGCPLLSLTAAAPCSDWLLRARPTAGWPGTLALSLSRARCFSLFLCLWPFMLSVARLCLTGARVCPDATSVLYRRHSLLSAVGGGQEASAVPWLPCVSASRSAVPGLSDARNPGNIRLGEQRNCIHLSSIYVLLFGGLSRPTFAQSSLPDTSD